LYNLLLGGGWLVSKAAGSGQLGGARVFKFKCGNY